MRKFLLFISCLLLSNLQAKEYLLDGGIDKILRFHRFSNSCHHKNLLLKLLIPRGPRGPVGPEGPVGPQGSEGPVGPQGPEGTLVTNYLSAFSESTEVQSLPVTESSLVGVKFDHDLFTGVGIIHPVEGDTSKFEVINSGFYLVGWTVTVYYNTSAMSAGAPRATLSLRLSDVTSGEPGTAFDPTPFQRVSLDQGVSYPPRDFLLDFNSPSGQTILFLPAGTIIQLQARNEFISPGEGVDSNTLALVERTFFIMQIDDES